MGKYLPGLKIQTILGGVSMDLQKLQIETNPPHIIVGTPGRTLDLINRDIIKLENVNYFILDECDKILENLGKFFCDRKVLTVYRHERRYTKNLFEDKSEKAGYDVYSHVER